MKQKLREQGQCTQCGKPATHSHECAFCHVATLAIVTIKGKYSPASLRGITEGFAKADLFKIVKDRDEDSGVRHIAYTVTSLSLAHGLFVNDVQREITQRLRNECAQIESQTEESKADYIRRVMEWMGKLLTHIKKTKS